MAGYTGINVNDSIMMRVCLVYVLMSSLLHVCCSQNLRLPLTSNHGVKKWVFDKICQFWKNWKSKLKKTHYDLFHTTRERLQYRPDRVDPVQWVLLIEFWGTKDGMV